jgi:FkbM family methyltransferase
MAKPRLKRVPLPDGRRIFCVNRDEVRRVQAQAEVYFKHGISLNPGDTVFDIGANIGLFSLDAAQKGALVHAFEPIPATFAALQANAVAFAPDALKVYNLALGVQSETVIFTYFPHLSALSTQFPDMARNEGPSAIERVLDDPQLTPRCGWFRNAPKFARKVVVNVLAGFLFSSKNVKCRVEPLSLHLGEFSTAEVALLKIDAEGAEMSVLQGIEKSDWPKISQIVAEVHDENGRLAAMQALLQGHGFKHIFVEEEPEAGEFGIYLLWARRN